MGNSFSRRAGTHRVMSLGGRDSESRAPAAVGMNATVP